MESAAASAGGHGNAPARSTRGGSTRRVDAASTAGPPGRLSAVDEHVELAAERARGLVRIEQRRHPGAVEARRRSRGPIARGALAAPACAGSRTASVAVRAEAGDRRADRQHHRQRRRPERRRTGRAPRPERRDAEVVELARGSPTRTSSGLPPSRPFDLEDRGARRLRCADRPRARRRSRSESPATHPAAGGPDELAQRRASLAPSAVDPDAPHAQPPT